MKKNKNIWKLGAILSVSAALLFLGMVFGGLSRTGLGIAWSIYAHQGSIVAGGLLNLVGTVFAYSHLTKNRPISLLTISSTLLLALEGFIGQFLLRGQGGYLTAIHYILSVIVLALVTAGASLSFALDLESVHEGKGQNLKNQFSKRTRNLILTVLAVLISGSLLSANGNGLSCEGWLLCSDLGIIDLSSVVHLIHRIFVAVVGVYLLNFWIGAWKIMRTQRMSLVLSNSLVIFYFAQAYIGALFSMGIGEVSLVVLHEMTAAAIIVTGSLLLVDLNIRQWNDERENTAVQLKLDRSQRFKDFIQLNKPVVVSLLLATTFAGMVMGYKGVPSARIVIVTLVSGALAAGGSGAINQFIDRDIDQKMTRTSKRPIPAGRLTPAEGLAFGVSALLISFYLMAGLVNMLAALLTLAGMVYYVVLYSILLKRRSVQNIVIGGGAGAIPPLVGWAAATGELNLAACFLFLIIFLWTPPHFWALALTRKNEYAAAEVPMMPVAMGEEVTKKLILEYSIVLVATTILMWLLGLAGWLYLVGAVLLGMYLLLLAWRVWRVGRNRVYYKMYRHSNYYLLLLFLFLAVDSVLI